MDDYMTPDEVAATLRVSVRKAYALKHTIGYLAIGGNVRFERAAVAAYIERCKRGPAQRGDTQWESRFATAPPGNAGSSPRRVSADDINARLAQRRKRESTPPNAAQN